jgi:dihydroorotase
MEFLFKSATVVSSSGQKTRDIYVKDGKIVAPFKSEVMTVIDCEGKLLLPGIIDCHVHFREPGATHKGDFESESRAAACGGVTTVLDMPNNTPPILTAADLAEKRKIVRGRSYTNYGFFVGAGQDTEALKSIEGACGIKLYMGSSTGNLLVDDPDKWEEIFKIAKVKNLTVTVHAEKESRVKSGMERFKNDEDPCAYAHARDCQCAREATCAALELRKKIGNKVHIAHLSCKSELELMKEFKNPNLTCEVAPHHLFFTMEDMEDAFLKMNPPLRTITDVEALWRGLMDGTVSLIVTDHAPHTLEEKREDMWTAPAGVPGVQFVLPLMLNSVNEERIPLEKLVALLCENPARIFGLKGKGKIEEGYAADLVLVDMKKTHTIVREDVLSKCGFSPYEFFTLKGWPVLTMINGEIVMKDGRVSGEKVGVEVSLS